MPNRLGEIRFLAIMPSAARRLVAGGSSESTKYNFSDLSKFKVRRTVNGSPNGSAGNEQSRGPMKGRLSVVISVKFHMQACIQNYVYCYITFNLEKLDLQYTFQNINIYIYCTIFFTDLLIQVYQKCSLTCQSNVLKEMMLQKYPF